MDRKRLHNYGQVLDVEQFYVGQRVQMTAEALAQFPMTTASRRGVVVGQSRDKKAIRVQQDGKRTVRTWHPLFWVGFGPGNRAAVSSPATPQEPR